MNVSSWLTIAKRKINALDAELILLNTIGEKDRSFLTLHEDKKLAEEELKKANEFLERRASGEPLAYILGYKEFYGRDFLVEKGARSLIPRTETESIIEMAKTLKPAPRKILDIGTGSGCIAITLKLENPEVEVLASDFSQGVLELAKENAKNLGTDVKFIQSDLLDSIDGNFDLIVANLPYVDEDWDWLDKKTLKYEPKEALYAEDGGLFLIKKLIHQAKGRTKYLVLESDTSQQEEIIEYAKEFGFSLARKDDFITLFKTF